MEPGGVESRETRDPPELWERVDGEKPAGAVQDKPHPPAV